MQSDDGLEAHFRLLVWSKLDFDLVLGVDVIHGGGVPPIFVFFHIFYYFFHFSSRFFSINLKSCLGIGQAVSFPIV